MRNKMSLTPKTTTGLNIKKVLFFTLLGGSFLSVMVYIVLTFLGVIGKPSEVFAANGLGYNWEATISIDHSQVSGQSALNDFPFLIKVSNPNLRHVSLGGMVNNINGFDVVFADMNDNLLEHQIESYDSNLGEVIAWVKIPVLSATVNTDLKLFYGNSTITTNQSSDDVWNSNYEGVWHMNNNPSTSDLIDGSGLYNAQGFGGMDANNLAAGKIGLATVFDGVNDYFAIRDKKFNASASIPSLTISGWFKTSYNHSSWTNNWALLDFDRSEYFNLFVHANGKIGFATRGSGQGSGIDDFYVGNSGQYNDGNWHYVAAVYDGVDKYVYVDGLLAGTKINPHHGNPLGTGATRYGFIGDGSEASTFNGNRNNKYYEGQYDEIRFSKVALSADWILTAYANQNTPEAFINVVFSTSPLPVELVDFDVELEDESVKIRWSTATEINNDYFTIEKSEDAVNYEFVEEIVGAGNSNTFKEYNYIDDSYTSGVIYYRLKQTDFDGEFVYFPPKSVNQEDTSEEFKIISVQPNPFTYKFSINIQSKNEGVAEFTLTDLNGNNIQTSLVGINEGKTEFMYMQGNKLAAGTYVVNLVMRGEKISYKVVKQ